MAAFDPAEILATLPHQPGVYRMLGASGEALYVGKARALMGRVPGVVIEDDPSANVYPLATRAAGTDEVYVGRVRQDASVPGNRGLVFWCVSDNLRKGAALNAVQIAEVLINRKLIKPKAQKAA